MEEINEMQKDFRIGRSFRLQPVHPIHDHKWHIRGIVDNMIVVRRWSYKKKHWIYVIESPWYYFFYWGENKITWLSP